VYVTVHFTLDLFTSPYFAQISRAVGSYYCVPANIVKMELYDEFPRSYYDSNPRIERIGEISK
jgi:hypothetical protein